MQQSNNKYFENGKVLISDIQSIWQMFLHIGLLLVVIRSRGALFTRVPHNPLLNAGGYLISEWKSAFTIKQKCCDALQSAFMVGGLVVGCPSCQLVPIAKTCDPPQKRVLWTVKKPIEIFRLAIRVQIHEFHQYIGRILTDFRGLSQIKS